MYPTRRLLKGSVLTAGAVGLTAGAVGNEHSVMEVYCVDDVQCSRREDEEDGSGGEDGSGDGSNDDFRFRFRRNGRFAGSGGGSGVPDGMSQSPTAAADDDAVARFDADSTAQ